MSLTCSQQAKDCSPAGDNPSQRVSARSRLQTSCETAEHEELGHLHCGLAMKFCKSRAASPRYVTRHARSPSGFQRDYALPVPGAGRMLSASRQTGTLKIPLHELQHLPVCTGARTETNGKNPSQQGKKKEPKVASNVKDRLIFQLPQRYVFYLKSSTNPA